MTSCWGFVVVKVVAMGHRSWKSCDTKTTSRLCSSMHELEGTHLKDMIMRSNGF